MDYIKQDPSYIPLFRSVAKSIEAMRKSGKADEIAELAAGAFRYFFGDGEEPDFSNFPMAQIVWLNAKPTIEKSIARSKNMRRIGNRNAQKNANETQMKRKKTQIERNAEHLRMNCDYKEKEKDIIKETILSDSKENAPLFSLNVDDPIHQSKMHPENQPFPKWTREQFKHAIDEAVAKTPEFAPLKAGFYDYWSEPNPKGKMKFQLEKTWDTERRLRRWKERAEHNRPSAPAKPAPQSAADIIRERNSEQ